MTTCDKDVSLPQTALPCASGTPWQHPLVKQGTIKPLMGETTPFVFKGRLYRLENWQKFMEIPRATAGERYLEDVVRVWDVEADRLVSVALTGHSFGTAFVWQDRVHVYSAAHPANNQWRTVTEITLTTSDDLLHWTAPEVVVRAEPGEHLFNAAVCRGPDRFILLYETDDTRWPAFTFKYCESDDLRSWRLIPDAVYGRDKYVGGPALYFEDGWYYTLYLQDLGGKWETRITRSRDLINWEDAPADRPFLTFDETRLFQYWHNGELRTVKEINASDAELCEWRGKTLVYFNGGDQQSSGDLQLAEFDGPPRRLFEAFFIQPATLVPSDRRGRIPEAEVVRLTEFGAAINRRFGQPLARIGHGARWKDDMTLELPLAQPADIGYVVLEEDLRSGQRVRCYRIEARVDGHWREVAAGESVGRRRIQRLHGVNTDCLRLRVLDGDTPLNIRAFACFL